MRMLELQREWMSSRSLLSHFFFSLLRFVIKDPKARGSPDDDSVPSIQGLIEWKWSPMTMRGVACDMDSVGYKSADTHRTQWGSSVPSNALIGGQ